MRGSSASARVLMVAPAWANNYGTTLPLSVLSGALKIADKVTVAMEAVGDKIRLNSQGWKDARVIGERQGADGRGA